MLIMCLPAAVGRSAKQMFIRFGCLMVLWTSLTWSAQAHDPGLSAVALQSINGRLHADLSMALPDVRTIVPSLEADAAGWVPQSTLDASLPQWQSLASNAFEVEWSGHRVFPEKVEIQAGDSRAIHFQITFPREAASKLMVRSDLISRLSRGHRQYLALRGKRGEL